MGSLNFLFHIYVYPAQQIYLTADISVAQKWEFAR